MCARSRRFSSPAGAKIVHQPSSPPTDGANGGATVIAKLAEIVRTTVTQVIASAIPSTDSTNRSGRRRMLASANRTRHTKVFPEAVAIAGDRTVVGADVSTKRDAPTGKFHQPPR